MLLKSQPAQLAPKIDLIEFSSIYFSREYWELGYSDYWNIFNIIVSKSFWNSRTPITSVTTCNNMIYTMNDCNASKLLACSSGPQDWPNQAQLYLSLSLSYTSLRLWVTKAQALWSINQVMVHRSQIGCITTSLIKVKTHSNGENKYFQCWNPETPLNENTTGSVGIRNAQRFELTSNGFKSQNKISPFLAGDQSAVGLSTKNVSKSQNKSMTLKVNKQFTFWLWKSEMYS